MKSSKGFSIWSAVFVLAGILMAAAPADAEVTIIKTALITPEGSSWTNTLYDMAREIEKETAGEVIFKIYAGGISGDEMDVLRKMRVNRIHAAGFSGVGLGMLVPEIRILEAPLLFQNYEEIDWVKDRLYDEFSLRFEKKGFVLLGFVEAGFVYFFSRADLSDPEGLRKAKMWVWKGDPVAESFLNTFGIKTYPLHVTDVNTGLETGMIDSFYSPTLASIAFQWYTRIHYMLDYPMVNSTGAFLLKKNVFDALSEQNQKILVTQTMRYARRLVQLTREENLDARTVLAESGIEFLSPKKEQVDLFMENAHKTYEKNMPGLYSKELFNRVQDLLEAYRAAR